MRKCRTRFGNRSKHFSKKNNGRLWWEITGFGSCPGQPCKAYETNNVNTLSSTGQRRPAYRFAFVFTTCRFRWPLFGALPEATAINHTRGLGVRSVAGRETVTTILLCPAFGAPLEKPVRSITATPTDWSSCVRPWPGAHSRGTADRGSRYPCACVLSRFCNNCYVSQWR